MKILTLISRLIIGSLFIVSGLIKANDPTGFAYKLEEYFSPDVLNLEWLIPYALFMAVLICIGEIVLGVAAIMGAKIKLVSGLLLLMMLFFTFLTFYSAYFEKVTDCGCFGDAIKLSPWQSFYKDVVLLVLVIFLFIQRNRINANTLTLDIVLAFSSILLIAGFAGGYIGWHFPIYFTLLLFALIILLKKASFLPERSALIIISISLLFSCGFSFYVIRHLPIKDFRPYKLGTFIPDKMKDCNDLQLPCPEYKVVYTLAKLGSGETKEVSSDDYIAEKIWEDKSWGIVTDKTQSILVEKGYEPPIQDFIISGFDGEDVTDMVLTDSKPIFWVIAYDIMNQNNITASGQIDKLVNQSDTLDWKVYGLTASTYENTESYRHQVQAMYDYFTADEKVLKTIIRSNPGIVLIKKGTILGKWHYNDLPEMDQLKADFFNKKS